MASALKTIVSKNKRRYVEDGFNLDLSYINERIIAMGFPAVKVESIYRNSFDKVKQFLDSKHPNQYFIYNLCSERGYDAKKFNGRVASYPFDDHHPPDFAIIQPFCDDVNNWLAKNSKNVAVIHCKAGKGRTGVMICCYLLHSMEYRSAEEVLKFYGQQRTLDDKGVTIPSQKRYISYYADLVRKQLEYKPVKLYLRYISFDPVPSFFNLNEFYVQIEVKQNKSSKFESQDYLVRRSGRHARLILPKPLLIQGDVKIEIFSKFKLDILTKRSKEFHFWFNTFFIKEQCNNKLCHQVSTLPNEDETTGSDIVFDDNIIAPLNGSNHINSNSRSSNIRANHVISMGESSTTSIDEETSLSSLMKQASVSDDALTQNRQMNQHSFVQPTTSVPDEVIASQSRKVNSTTSSSSSSSAGSINSNVPALIGTTQPSFSENRTRHSSVPQTSKKSTLLHHISHSVDRSSHSETIPISPPPILMPGKNLIAQLERKQIDKVVKDKTSKYADNFQVTLALFQPDNQDDVSVPLANHHANSFKCFKPADSSSEEDTTEGSSNVDLPQHNNEQLEFYPRAIFTSEGLTSAHPPVESDWQKSNLIGTARNAQAVHSEWI